MSVGVYILRRLFKEFTQVVWCIVENQCSYTDLFSSLQVKSSQHNQQHSLVKMSQDLSFCGFSHFSSRAGRLAY